MPLSNLLRSLFFCLPLAVGMTNCSPRQSDVGWDKSPRVEVQDIQLTALRYELEASAIRVTLLIRNVSGRDLVAQRPDDPTTTWLTASSPGYQLNASPMLLTSEGNGIDDVVMRVDLPLQGPLMVPAHTSLFVDAAIRISPPFATLEVPWSVTLKGQWGTGEGVSLTLPIPADHEPDPREITQSGRP